MPGKGKYWFNIFPLLIWLLLASCQQQEAPTLTIATAANARFAIETIAQEFTTKTGIKTRVVISSSGKHTAQIEAGAPYDVFLSADMKYPESLFAAGLTTGKPAIYAYGKLVLWTLNDSLKTNLTALTANTISHIALPNPKTAPYGQAAYEALQAVGIYPAIVPKLVYGESVAQANQFILSGAAEIGFTAAAIVQSPAMQNKGHWQYVDETLYTPIAQGAVVLKQSRHMALAQKFYLYLFSSSSREILQRYGYILPMGK